MEVCSKFLLYLIGPHIVIDKKNTSFPYVYYICRSLTYVYT